MALTNKQKQEALRKRRAAAGLKELRGVWIPAGMEEEIREVIRHMIDISAKEEKC
jgi:hypothetical protein